MLNIANHQGNANQNCSELSPHTGQNGHHQSLQRINAGENVEKVEPSCTVGGMNCEPGIDIYTLICIK